MSGLKTDLERKEEDDKKSGIFCARCGSEILKSELEVSKQSENYYLCSCCRNTKEKTENE